VSSGSGTASANVSNVQVTCTTTTYTIGGTVSGLTASGLVLADGSQTVSPASGATSFAFPTAVASGSSYAVTVKTQPSGETCSVTSGSGTASANVSNVQVTCEGEWTWMGGSIGVGSLGVYGTLGTAASTNIPGARYSAVRWSDASGNLWLFGGDGDVSTGTPGILNDLWKFDPSLGAAGEWTWMGGSSTGGQSGVYGTLGTAASTNIPGGRDSAVSWSDASGNLWLFGGYGYDSTGTDGHLNDLWKFDPSLGTYGEWTWMGGSSTGGQSGVYGTLGTAASTNIPGGRDSAVSWSDASGNLWLFGGYGYDSTGTGGWLNDLWKFDPALGTTGEWTWMGGSFVSYQYGVYGTLGTAASTNAPGARLNAVSWSDASGNVWLFGGFGYDSTGVNGQLNDLWEYQP
jgi:N-acetylneuraminic acid mutarotase